MKQQINAHDSTERFVPAQYILSDGTIETYSNYVVSNWGRVGRTTTQYGNKKYVMKILKPSAFNKRGYLCVGLSINNKVHRRQVHRLVLSSFHPELWSVDTNEVDHIDRDPAHNYLDNLHWTDRNGNHANRSIGALKRIRVTYLSDSHIELFDNMHDCSEAFGKYIHWCAYVIYRQHGFNAKLNIMIEKI